MADYASAHDRFVTAGASIVAISVDPPERSAALSRDLKIGFPLISDASRATITEWGLLNEREGEIAIPATFLIDSRRMVRFRETEETMRRVPPAEMLDLVRALGTGNPQRLPSKRAVNPGIMFLRALLNGFRHGVRVKRE